MKYFDIDPDEVADDTVGLAELQDAEGQLECLPLERRVQLAYGEADLGTRCFVYGGEVYEFPATIKRKEQPIE